MLLKTKAFNAAGGEQYGIGGSGCACCSPEPRRRKAVRRTKRRQEARAWRKDWGV